MKQGRWGVRTIAKLGPWVEQWQESDDVVSLSAIAILTDGTTSLVKTTTATEQSPEAGDSVYVWELPMLPDSEEK